MKARPYNTPGEAHELTFSCYRRLPLFDRAAAREVFIDSLREAARKHRLEIWAFVVMPEHVHVLFWPTSETYDVSSVRRTLKSRCATKLLPRIKADTPEVYGHLLVPSKEWRQEIRFWQKGKGYDRNLFSPEAISRAIDYIHANPFRRGIAISTGDWPWSSYQTYLDGSDLWSLVTAYREYLPPERM